MMSIRKAATAVLGTVLVAGVSGSRVAPTPPDVFVRPNPNIARAGVLHDGVLTVSLEAKPSLWRFSASHAPMVVEAFAEHGKAPLMPGPFIRVPAGTSIQLTIHNLLPAALTFVLPAALHGGPDRLDAMDSVVVAPGAVATLATRASTAGSFIYRGKLPDGVTRVSNIAGMLAGAIVVDDANVVTPAHDRVFVVMATEDSASVACDDTTTVNPLTECRARRFIYTIDGTQWPRTDRVHATVGDSLHWRVINASYQVHPMHLHGFYFRVDTLTGPLAKAQRQPVPGQLVVTQLLEPLSAMSMSWSPDRPGNWLFHCHFALHNSSFALLATPDDPNMRDMVGLVIGTIVAPRPGAVAAVTRPAGVRHLRLVAERGGASTTRSADTLPPMRFVIDENGRRSDTHADISPELDLVRGQPVAITIVNHLEEPTTVHWHGIEVQDSYADGAAGFSGAGHHLAPAIAPGDSFVAHFTPTRAGTFLYHSHMDEMREELAGLAGVLIVQDSAGAPSLDDHAFLFKGEARDVQHPFEINGQRDPDTLVVRVGRTIRLRLLNLSTSALSGAPAFWLTARPDSAEAIARDTMIARWTEVAKDGFDLPASARSLRPAQEIVSVGETFDFVYTPTARGQLRLEVRGATGQHPLYARVPIRVE